MRATRIIGLVLGGVLLGAVVSATAQEGAQQQQPQPVPTAVAPAPAADPNRPPRQKPQRQRPAKQPGRDGPMRSEAVFAGANGGPNRTVRIDNGVIQSIDGTTVVVHEQDGTDVRVPTDDQTRFARDGQRATLQSLKAGDHVHAVRHKEGDAAFRTVGIRAISPERYAEMQAQRERCQSDPQACRRERQQQKQDRPEMRRPEQRPAQRAGEARFS